MKKKLQETVYDDRIVRKKKKAKRTLLLNQGYQPVGACRWQKAMCMLFLGKAEIIEEYDWEVRSASDIFPAPAVLRLKDYDKLGPEYVKFSRENVYLRDEYVCQYCRVRFGSKKLTLDHVVPRAHGGHTNWNNIVTACWECNYKKADRTPKEAGMPLLKAPEMPNGRHPAARSFLNRGRIPQEWQSWLH